MKAIIINEPKACQTTIQNTWCEFRNSLAKNTFEYDDICTAKQTVFLKQFDQLFQNTKVEFEKDLNTLSKNNLIRATRLNENEFESPLEYSRMLPDKRYITEDNRFSPKGVEWLYLAYSPTLLEAKNCSLKECRAQQDEIFAYCQFTVDEKIYDKKIVDLTIADEYSYNQINQIIYKHSKKIDDDTMQKIKKDAQRWTTLTYAKLLSTQIFTPVKNNKKYKYAPFHCLAQYFYKQGYVGIMYKSTVCPNGKNLVLFDKTFAIPFEDIVREKIK